MTYTKFKSHGSYQSEFQASKEMKNLQQKNKETDFHIHKKGWKGKDKTRYQIRSVVRKGTKR